MTINPHSRAKIEKTIFAHLLSMYIKKLILEGGLDVSGCN